MKKAENLWSDAMFNPSDDDTSEIVDEGRYYGVFNLNPIVAFPI